jgi:hypothetical protein
MNMDYRKYVIQFFNNIGTANRCGRLEQKTERQIAIEGIV